MTFFVGPGARRPRHRARPMGGRSCLASAEERRVVVVAQGDVFWASLPEPAGSGPGSSRPVVMVQGDALNASNLATAVVVPLTST
ncbi:MAG: type II toxin-antitoxin system PemK/MazF family toxin [Acidimicrobiales bacterium]